ncbi:hypothetical protein EPUS_07848 [Endocarpon pusillum Z07020]|uniref:Required for respiratory growth protein 9, mitochondrial n=1 Tax=Endocarpon pusillum (strain Z07020 / HMAS-L-300199) TaxID=1263415 RepID=U1HKG6_ENDPU|nr:uncharacterized protein EPUS_07848 [Endocarpon pusillum Z07020]ERF69444.1 hypothetical protein EPUS_07848 [Endocarpon pusillum Z07020]
MTPKLQASTRLLSVVIRLSNVVVPTRRSLRIVSAPVSPRLPKSRTQSPHPLSYEHTAQIEADISDGRSHEQRFRRAKEAVSAPFLEKQPAHIEVNSVEGGDRTRRLQKRRSSDPATSGRTYRKSEKPDLHRHIGHAFTQNSDAGPMNDRTAGSKGENAKRVEPQAAADEDFQRPREHWQIQKDALKEKFGEEGWSPRKKLSPDTMEGIRALHEQYPQKYTTPVLAEQFKVSPEAIRRILKSKWRPSPEKMEERRARWAKRHDRIWDAQAEMGLRPKRTKDRKPEGPESLDDIIPPIQNVGP